MLTVERCTGLSQFLREYAPDFCWMSVYDLLIFTEQVFPDIDYNSFKVTLNKLLKEGVFEVKEDEHAKTYGLRSGKRPCRLYKRKGRP